VTEALTLPARSVVDSNLELREKKFVKMLMNQQKKLERALRKGR